MTPVLPVILCGGSGTRLWPLSRSGFPKQFLVLSGDGSNQSLFQQAIARVHSVKKSDVSLGKTIIVTNEEHRFLALDQLRELPNVSASLLLEPSGKNTAPALTLEVAGNMSVDAFVEFDQTIATNYTITTGRNALTAGPISINSGTTVTVPSGSTWTIV